MITKEQRQALDPRAIVWVSASAGAGKTTVLTDRLLTLMLHGEAPRRFLCLAFTRAAAEEMEARLKKHVAAWADPKHAASRVRELIGSDSVEHTARAQELASRADLEMPTFQTIHGFCQALLQKHAQGDTSGDIVVLEEEQALRLWAAAFRATLSDPDPIVKSAMVILASHYTETEVKERLWELLRRRSVRPFSRESIMPSQHASARMPLPEALHEPLTTRDREIYASLHTPDTETYRAIFLTKDGHRRKRILSDACLAANAQLRAWLEAEQARVYAVHQEECAHKIWLLSKSFFVLYTSVLARYQTEKEDARVLDFDDLLHNTLALLTSPETMGPALAALGTELSHLLIDESQDLSALQWKIVRILGEMLILDKKGTVFVVGDPKQSIYGFQGADPRLFHEVKAFFRTCAKQANLPWRDVSLTVSFRSVPKVLDVVNAVSHAMWPDVPPLMASIPSSRGSVSVIEDAYPEEPEEDEWAVIPPVTLSVMQKAAVAWANRIRAWLFEAPLSVNGCPATPRDILVLVMKRDAFSDALGHALIQRQIPFCGRDRMMFSEDLVIEDLLALARWALLPLDDFSLACVLRGTLMGCSEDTLYRLAHNRGEASLWARVKQYGERERLPVERLLRWKKDALELSPTAFFMTILEESRARIVSRLGHIDEELLDAFILWIFTAEQKGNVSLTHILKAFSEEDPVFRRDLSHAGEDAVRIMTVHGAKGLEAPIVIIPDAHRITDRPEPFLFGADQARFCWRPQSGADVPFTAALKERTRADALEEYKRLFYVAMTRAKEHLILGSWASPLSESWLTLVEKFT